MIRKKLIATASVLGALAYLCGIAYMPTGARAGSDPPHPDRAVCQAAFEMGGAHAGRAINLPLARTACQGVGVGTGPAKCVISATTCTAGVDSFDGGSVSFNPDCVGDISWIGFSVDHRSLVFVNSTC